jgi:hypothetical protein
MDLDPRPIAGSVAVRNYRPEHEKPSRWSFMKVLREHSDLKEFYPEVNPFVECYKVRPNTYVNWLSISDANEPFLTKAHRW